MRISDWSSDVCSSDLRLALHFLATEERIRTAAEIRKRLEPGAPFVAAHGSLPQEAGTRDRWLDRYAAFAIAPGGDPDPVPHGRQPVAHPDARLGTYPRREGKHGGGGGDRRAGRCGCR